MKIPDPQFVVSQALERATSLASWFYEDTQVFALEKDFIFHPSWQLLGHESRLLHVGDHVVGEVAGVPICVLRDDARNLRAFHNVCRHRAGPLLLHDGCGARSLQCRYHGWTYNLQGQLRSAPEMDLVQGFDSTLISLPEARLEQWQGLVFVTTGVVPSLVELMQGLEHYTIEDLGLFQFHRRVAYEIRCNWKVYVDNYLEGYHLPHVHPALNRVLDYRQYRTEIFKWHSLQTSALNSKYSSYGEGSAFYRFIYPNTMLNILPGRLQTNRVFPIDAHHCRVEFDYYYAAECTPAFREQDQQSSDDIQKEDIAICEAVQRGLASGSYSSGRLHPQRELGLHHFHELYRAAWRKHFEPI
jgi:choline monooxygenase